MPRVFWSGASKDLGISHVETEDLHWGVHQPLPLCPYLICLHLPPCGSGCQLFNDKLNYCWWPVRYVMALPQQPPGRGERSKMQCIGSREGEKGVEGAWQRKHFILRLIHTHSTIHITPYTAYSETFEWGESTGSDLDVITPLLLDVCGVTGFTVPLPVLWQVCLEFNMCLAVPVTDHICSSPTVLHSIDDVNISRKLLTDKILNGDNNS